MEYTHTQKSKLYLVILIIEIIIFSIIFIFNHFELTILFILLFLLFITYSFSSLKVTVGKKSIKLKFGQYGIFRKNFLLKDIISSKIVKNHWYYGWGIRLWFWPYMWIYNIYGLDAVEIIMKNGKKYRIGTDEPEKLKKAISKAK